ncbi:uncharacterized protein LOC141599006 isoform X2 [Silene latifolia]
MAFSHFPLRFRSLMRIPLITFTSIKPTKCALSQFPKIPFSTSATPYPLQYDMIISRPSRRRGSNPPRLAKPRPESPGSDSDDSVKPARELSFEDWVDKKLTEKDGAGEGTGARMEAGTGEGYFGKMNSGRGGSGVEGMDKAKRKYYNKREKRMYGEDSDDERRRIREKSEVVELEPEVVEFRTLHKREEELYFYDAFALPWEKDKHYKMVYQLEKKYFPDQCLDKAFLEPGKSNVDRERKAGVDKGFLDSRKSNVGGSRKAGVVDKGNLGSEKSNVGGLRGRKAGVGKNMGGDSGEEDKKLVFFEEMGDGKDSGVRKDGVEDLSEKKVEEFFKCLKKVPNKDSEVHGGDGPFLASRSTGLPRVWDSPAGTVVLVNKPKGWTSFTVCGKLRRLTNVKKVGHAGTLDPMATGLLIVCVGKATKVVDRYQGMIKGYSGTFRLGEATSTWDADSPVIQREPWEHIKEDDIKKAAASFMGEIWQVPPMFSAIKVGGEKMYDKARRGESIELAPRRISILQFDIERSLEDRQNLIFRVICSKGTYIRSLCADLGKALGSCAHLTALRRDSIGDYAADDAYEFQELEDLITKRYV